MTDKHTPGPFFVRFDGPPSHDSGRFVEVETQDGRSVGPDTSGAHWYLQDDGTWLLGPFGYAVLEPMHTAAPLMLEALREIVIRFSDEVEPYQIAREAIRAATGEDA